MFLNLKYCLKNFIMRANNVALRGSIWQCAYEYIETSYTAVSDITSLKLKTIHFPKQYSANNAVCPMRL